MDIFLMPVFRTFLLITAITNIVGFLFVYLSCRFVPSLNIGKSLMQKKWYKSYYRYHTRGWWLLVPSVAVHATIAFLRYLAGG